MNCRHQDSKQRPATLPLLLAVLLLTMPAAALADGGPASASRDGVEINVTVDHPDGLYKSGEEATFTIRVTRAGKPVDEGQVSVKTETVVSRPGQPQGYVQEVETATLKLVDGKAAAVRKFTAAGNMMLQASYTFDEGKPVTMEVGVVADPQALQPALPPPDDFDAFWQAQKKLLADEPMKPVLTPVDPPQPDLAEKIECFDVQINCPGGAPVSGYFARPKGAAPKSLPAIISFHGAGVRSANLSGPAMWASTWAGGNRLAMDINAHGIPNGRPAEFYAELAAGRLKNYPTQGLDNRQDCYFRGMYLRVLRALEFLTSQPQWDGSTLIVVGGSQGAAQSLAAAGLDARVSLVHISIPAVCDLGAQEAGRPAGWPVRGQKLEPRQVETLRYFDGCHLAARIKATTVIRIGLADRVCWPTSTLAMVNQLKGPKLLVTSPPAMHLWSPPGAFREAEVFFHKTMTEQEAAAKKK